MNHRRFDDLARVLGLAASRRQVLKALVVGALGGGLALTRRVVAAGGACPKGLTDCSGDGQCTDLTSNPDNCGVCFMACPSGQCINSMCVPLPCPAGQADCGGGMCVDLTADSFNCGGCGIACASGRLCAGGACVCPSGLFNCGPYCADLQNDADNCGTCGTYCPSRVCAGGACVPSCPGGLTDCGGGVCADLTADPFNCGFCGNFCESGACGGGVCAPVAPPTPTPEPEPTPVPATLVDAWDLWTGGTRLRGAHVQQRRVYPAIDDPAVMGDGPVGPPISQEALDRLAALGANYVDISHPGPFAEDPPYDLDPAIQSNLDELVEMAAQAGLYAVITFRTGPGRSEFGFHVDDAGTWFDRDLLNDAIWTDEAAQDAWAEMWRQAGERYLGNPAVVGYNLLAEPNADSVLMGTDDPARFYPAFADTPADWNRLAQRLTDAVREVDATTPLLVAPMGRGAIAWLPYLQPTDDDRTVYRVHQFEPDRYVRSEPDATETPALEYPGGFDPDVDDGGGSFDRAWLEDLLTPVAEFAAAEDAPVAVGAFGVPRWQVGAERFLDDQMALFEDRGWNHGLWLWGPAAPEHEDAGYDIRLGPDPDNRDAVETSDLLEVVRAAWTRNVDRPSAPAP